MSQWHRLKPSAFSLRCYGSAGKVKRQSGSHKTLARNGWPDYVSAFHEGDEIGPKMLARVAKHTGLSQDEL